MVSIILLTFQELLKVLDDYEPKIKSLLSNGEKMVEENPGEATANLAENLGDLRMRWDSIRSRAGERRTKLDDALHNAEGFHDNLNQFMSWLTDVEKRWNSQKPVSRILPTITEQIGVHKDLQSEIAGKRNLMSILDKTGTHMKYFSQRQDVVLIKNLLNSVQHRWEKVGLRAAERTRHLEQGLRDAKKFHDAWKDLLAWLDENERVLDADTAIGNDPEVIKQQIIRHKEFQRMLGTKQPALDAINHMGRILKDKCPNTDTPAVQEMLMTLKNKWNGLCGKSVER